MVNSAATRALAFVAAVLISLSGASFVTTAQAAVVFQKLIDYGQERPDKADPDSADVFLDVACAAIEGDDVIFRALNDGFRTGYDSIWTIKADGSGLRKLVGKNQSAPGGIGNFSAFGSSYGGDFTTSPLLRNGQVVFLGYDANPDPTLRGAAGLYSIPLAGGPIKRIANYNTVNPSNGGFLFGQFTGFSQQGCHNAYAFDGNTVFFTAATLGNSDPSGVYRAKFDGSDLAVVRDNNDPDTSFPFFQPRNFFAPTLGVNPVNGKALFGYTGANVFGIQALYANHNHLLLHANNNLPDDPSPTPREASFNYFLFDGRTAVFQATAGSDYFGIFSRRGAAGPLHKIVTNLSTLPGISQCPIGTFGNFVADANRVFFNARASNCDGQTANGRSGIFMAKGGKIMRIIGYGDKLDDGSVVLDVFIDDLGPGSVHGKRLVFSVRTTLSVLSLYAATVP